MKKKPQPYFRKFDGWWYVQIVTPKGRQQVKLVKGKAKEEQAWNEYHRVMAALADGEDPNPDLPDDSVRLLMNVFYKQHVVPNCSESTANWYRNFLRSFRKSVGDDLTFSKLNNGHVIDWYTAKTWSSTTKNCAVRAVRTCFRWLSANGKIPHYPFEGLKAPKKKRREVYISPEKFEEIMKFVKDHAFKDYLRFLFLTGARPQEANSLKKCHCELHLNRIVFPPSEAKGKEYHRVIYLNDEAMEIVNRLHARRKSDDEFIFLNARHRPWNRNAVRCRFRRMREKVGASFCAYHLRHSFATRALQTLDPITTSILMGHADASTLAKTYQHLAKNPQFLLEAARKAKG